MDMITLLYLFVIVNVLIIGILVVFAVRHYRAHKRELTDTKQVSGVETPIVLSASAREQLRKRAGKQFQDQIDKIALEMQQDLKETSVELDGVLQRVGKEIIDDELKRYRAGLDELRQAADTKLNSAQKAVAEHQAELDKLYAQRKVEIETQLQTDMTAEKARLSALVDSKLTDAVTSFLTEALAHNVDLGAQGPYLTALLEEHKDELKKEIAS